VSVDSNGSEELECVAKERPHFVPRGDLLYWVPQGSGLAINFGQGSFTRTTDNGFVTTELTEEDLDPSFKWNFGFRAGVGCEFDQNLWEVDALWTYFQSSGNSSQNQGKWTVRLNQIDLDASYKSSVNDCLTLTPLAGLRGTQIHQHITSTLLTPIEIDSVTSYDIRTLNDKQKFNALGPLLGVNADYKVGRGFSVYGNTALGILYGSYHLNFDDFEIDNSSASQNSIYSDIHKRMDAFDYNIDLVLGAQWETVFYQSFRLRAKLDVENHQYFNQIRLGEGWGNLSFSGATFSLSASF
jgi:hypothetical protein